MELVLEDFFTSYPDYVPDPDRLFAVYGDSDMYDIIQQKKEFSELKLASSEVRSREEGSLLLHQKYIRRFLSGFTPYHAVLLWHDVGTGKTISSIAVAEGIKKDQPDFQKALVICRGPTFIRNFKDELKKIAGDKYRPKVREDRELTENELTRRTNKLINSYYELTTFQVFGNHIKEILTMGEEKSTKLIREMYSNRVIIIDEVHNLRSKKAGGGDDTYANIHKFLHIVKNTKIVLLSATPIKDSVYEFADIMNLILPMNKQLPTRQQFVQQFFQQRGSEPPLLINKEQLLSIKGYISYLRQTRSPLRIIQAGEQIDGISVPIVVIRMSSPQFELYDDAYKTDTGGKPDDKPQIDIVEDDDDEEEDTDGDKSSGLYKLSRQASLFAYRDGDNKKYGSAIKARDLSNIAKLIRVPSGDNSNPAKLERLKKYSAKYHYIIDTILKNPTHNFFIFSKFVTGSGIMVLTALLKLFDFEEATGESRTNETKKKRFAEIKGTTVEGNVERLIDQFNRPENKYGDFIQVMIGSSVIGEGRSLKSVRDIIIVSPHWNYTEIDQAIGRGIRYESHNYLPEEEQQVTIHRLAVYSIEHSIDLQMYRMADKKDRMIKQLEYFIRETAIDCVNNKQRNTYPSELDNSRECLYQPCPYQCSIENHGHEIVDTYNLFYTEKEYQEIKQFIQTLFLSRLQFSYQLEEFLMYPELNRFTNIVLLRCLSTIIYQQEKFINPLGWTSYLKEQNNNYFLVYNMLSQSDQTLLYDTKLCQLYPSLSFEEYLTHYQYTHVMDILLQIKQQLDIKQQLVLTHQRETSQLERDGKQKTKPQLERDERLELARENYASIIFSHILLPIKLTILKEIIKVHPYSRHPNIEEIGRSNVEKFFVSKLKRYVSVKNGEYVISVDETSKVNEFIQILKEKQKQGFLYYGYDGEKDLPNISLISNIPVAKSKGQACTSYQPDKLNEMIDNLNKNIPPSEEPSKSPSKEQLCGIIKQSLERENLLTTLEISSKIKQIFNKKGDRFLDSYDQKPSITIEEKIDE